MEWWSGWSFAAGVVFTVWIVFMIWLIRSGFDPPPNVKSTERKKMPLGDPDPHRYGYQSPFHSEKWTWKGPVEVIDNIQKSLDKIEESLNRIVALLEGETPGAFSAFLKKMEEKDGVDVRDH